MNQAYVVKIFPEIKKIKDRNLRQTVISTWLRAVKIGGWKRIDDIPFTLLIKTKKSLIEHTRSVTNMAMAVARIRTDVDMDTIIAGGLLHDVGKLLEFKRSGRKFIKSPQGKLIRHPVSGYGLALESGVPVAISHIIAAHSYEGEKTARSREAIIIHHCDFIDFDIEKGAQY